MVNLGIIGYGYWGPKLLRNFSELKNVKVLMCADLYEKNLNQVREKYPGIKTTNNYLEILENPEIEAVVIATSVSTHFKFAKESIMHNKHVLIEKPMTKTSEEAEELIQLAKEKNRILMVDHTFEYSPEIAKIKELIDNKVIGDVYSINIARLNLGLYQGDGVNVVTDLAPHDISILYYLLGKKPIDIKAVGSCNLIKDLEDDANIHLKFDNNISANIHVSWIYPKKVRTISIIGSKKMIFFDGTNTEGEQLKIYDKGVDPQHPETSTGNTFADYIRALKYRYGDIQVLKIESYEPLNRMCSHFIECIEQNKTPRSDGSSGLNVVKTIEIINKSIKEN